MLFPFDCLLMVLISAMQLLGGTPFTEEEDEEDDDGYVSCAYFLKAKFVFEG